MAITEYWGSIINSIIFLIAFALFLVVKLSNTLTKGIVNAYFAFTFISALTLVGTVVKKYMSDTSFSLGYLGTFVLNAILGMMVMHTYSIKLFYAFFSIFIVCILAMLVMLADPPNASQVTPSSNTWFNLTGWDDFLKKTADIFNFPFEFNTSPSSFIDFLKDIFWIIKMPISLLVWIVYSLFSGASAFFGLFSTAQPPPVSKAFAQETYFGENVRKTISYSLTLLLFILGLIIIVASQKAMREQPLNVLAVAFVAAFSYLGYVRFFHSESFTSQFMMTLFGLFMIGIYLYNPSNILKNITGTSFTIIFFIMIYLIGMIFIYNFFADPSDISKSYKNVGDTVASIIAEKFKDSFSKIAYVMIAFSISISMIIWMVSAIANSQGGQPTPGMYILNALIVIGMLTIVYNSLDTNKILPENLYFKLFWNMILYIPCLISDLADLVMSEYYKMNYFTLIIVVLEIIFIIAYWFIYPDAISKIYSDGGKVIVNESTSLASLKTVGYYRKLSGSTLLDYKDNQVAEGSTTSNNKYGAFDGNGKVNAVSGKPLLDASGNPMKDDHGNYFMPTRVNTYHYCMSFWLYINPMPSYGDRFMSLLNYGNNPNVMYNPSKNDFSVFMKSPSGDCSNTDIIPIYTNMDIPLQKWFNVVLNYDSGRLDVFLNAELVKTSFDVISCIDYDALTIGENSGANAKICNLTYFQSPIDIVTIRRMYNVAKIQDTPVVPKKDLFSI